MDKRSGSARHCALARGAAHGRDGRSVRPHWSVDSTLDQRLQAAMIELPGVCLERDLGPGASGIAWMSCAIASGRE